MLTIIFKHNCICTISRKEKFFPDAGTPTQLFNGLPFNELPIAHVRVSPNNTIISFTDSKGRKTQ